MDVLDKDEFLKAYRSINAQLRKKFVGFRQEVRRPNVTDAVDGFERLSRKQLDLGFTELSAACRLAAAQLERSACATNAVPSGVIRQGGDYNNLFVESARTFSVTKEQVMIYECYEEAIGSTSDTNLAWFTMIEAGQTALHLNDYPIAISFFTKAFKLAENETEKHLSGDLLTSSFIRQGCYTEALKILAVIKPNQINCVTQILLALILKRYGESQQIQILPATVEIPENCLQPRSLQYAMESLKLGELNETSVEKIWSYLNLDQQQLLLCLSNPV